MTAWHLVCPGRRDPFVLALLVRTNRENRDGQKKNQQEEIQQAGLACRQIARRRQTIRAEEIAVAKARRQIRRAAKTEEQGQGGSDRQTRSSQAARCDQPSPR